MYYISSDHLGSINLIVDGSNGNVVDDLSYDSWGRNRNPIDWSYSNFTLSSITDRGYTSHEQLTNFGLINMNGRVYDPALGRMLSPDNYVQDPFFPQNYNRYAYCWNNPVKYTDPNGEWVHFVLGGIIGGIQGYMIGKQAGLEGGKLFLSTIAGAGIGVLSGGIANTIATGGGFMANTLAIAAASHTSSVGMGIVGGFAGVEVPYTLSIGVASITMGSEGIDFGYLGKPENTTLENIGYGLGALANVADILAGLKPGDVTLRTENDPSYDFKGSGKDPIGHTQVTKTILNEHGQLIEVPIIDWGPNVGVGLYDWVPGNNAYSKGLIPNLKGGGFWDPVSIRGVNVSRLESFSVGKSYNLLFNSCASKASRALNLSGVYNISVLPGIQHPYWLHAQMYLRDIGVRPLLFSHYLY
ncbi:MAG: RHS repeat-associated core domain-containing protein [Dysgonamonadaceae bacterium]|nr:RHS repeat-associated core domain-containing protein [Dysgonamonadaceae bacterium]